MAKPTSIETLVNASNQIPVSVDAGSVTLTAGDIQIGAVEIKNAADDTRAKVLAASTAAGATDTPLVVALHPSSPLGAGSAAIGKLAANTGVDIGDVDVTSIAAGDNNIGNVDVVTVGGQSPTFGAGAVAAGTQRVTMASDSPDVSSLATIAGDTTDIETAVEIMDDWDNTASDGASVSGDVAHDGVDAGEPVKVGMRAIAHGTNPTAVAAADRTDWLANRAGVPFVIGGHPNVLTASINVTDADGAQTDTALVTVAGGLKIVVTLVAVAADNANTGDVGFRLGFGTANTPAEDAAGLVAAHPGLDGGAGMIIGNGGGIVGVGADGADLRLTCEDPVAGSITFNVTYYTIES